MTDDEQPPGWVRWPVRVLAVVVVLPVRLLWELVSAVGRFLARYVGRPLAWLGHYAVVVPAAWAARWLVVVPLTFLLRWLVIVPGRWLGYWLIVVPVRWAWQHRRLAARPLHYLLVVPLAWFFTVTAPAWRALGRALAWSARWAGKAIGAVALATYRWVLRPAALAAWWVLSQVFRWVLRPGWRGAGWLLRLAYAGVLRPAGHAVRWVWRVTVVPAYRAGAVAARWVRESVLRPAGGVVRAVLGAFGVRSNADDPKVIITTNRKQSGRRGADPWHDDFSSGT